MTLERAALGMEHRCLEAHFPKEEDEEKGKEAFLNVTKVRPRYERGWGGAWRVGQKERAEQVLVVTFVRKRHLSAAERCRQGG